MVPHGLHECQRSADIVVIILDGLNSRLTDCLKTREVDNAVDLILLEDPVHRLSVADVRLVEFDLLSGKFLDPFQALPAGIAEIVDDHRFVAGVIQLDHGVAADITGSARY